MSLESDVLAIQQLKARYMRYLDTKSWRELRGVLTDDFTFYRLNPPSTMASSADEWIEIISTILATAVSVHQGYMPDIEITGERTATGIWGLSDTIDYGGGNGLHGFGYYHDEYEKGADGNWRIKSSSVSRLRVDDQKRRDLS